MNVLITSGATREPIDSVRVITNMSSGRTGATIAETIARLGARVTLLHGQCAVLPAEDGAVPIERESFSTAADLDLRLRARLAARDYGLVIHAAAVADYAVASIEQDGAPALDAGMTVGRKLDSRGNLTLRLAPTPKILGRLKTYSHGRSLIVGFKLTHTADSQERLEAVRRLLRSGDVDLVVHNDVGEIEAGRHRFRLHSPTGVLAEFDTPQRLARALFERRYS